MDTPIHAYIHQHPPNTCVHADCHPPMCCVEREYAPQLRRSAHMCVKREYVPQLCCYITVVIKREYAPQLSRVAAALLSDPTCHPRFIQGTQSRACCATIRHRAATTNPDPYNNRYTPYTLYKVADLSQGRCYIGLEKRPCIFQPYHILAAVCRLGRYIHWNTERYTCTYHTTTYLPTFLPSLSLSLSLYLLKSSDNSDLPYESIAYRRMLRWQHPL